MCTTIGAGALYVIVEYCAYRCFLCAQLLCAGAVYVIVEYCAHGCLRNYLVKNRSGFVDSLDYSSERPTRGHHAANNDYVNTPGVKLPQTTSTVSTDSLTLTTNDLICFAFQIARGMEYLASRNVSFYCY